MHKPLIIIPSYNTGRELLSRTVREALEASKVPIHVVIDGSNDGSEIPIMEMAKHNERLRLTVKRTNEGKGAAIRSGLMLSEQEGFTHALTMDADGQHSPKRISEFLEASKEQPDCMILGQPVFDDSVPLERLYGRKISVGLVALETLSTAVGDPLYGFRVYPIAQLLEVMRPNSRSNRYDFDPEVAVRLHWMGVKAIKKEAEVNYLPKEQGGVSHFHYLRDNLRFMALHACLICEAPIRWITRGASKSNFEK